MMASPRYRNQDLFLPKQFLALFSQKLLGASDNHMSFGRQVDLWWHALCIGVKEGRRTPLPGRDDISKFNDGGILEGDPWRITYLELLLLAEEDEDAASNPATVIQRGNEYAMTGCEILTEYLQGAIDPQLHLLARMNEP